MNEANSDTYRKRQAVQAIGGLCVLAGFLLCAIGCDDSSSKPGPSTAQAAPEQRLDSAHVSQWQGVTYRRFKPGGAARSRFLVLDTGGSGAGFGKGDVHYKLRDVHFWNDRLGWACGRAGAFMTRDGGLTWRRTRQRPERFFAYQHVEMSGENDIWLLEGTWRGGIGKVFLWRSTDGGQEWTKYLPGKIGGHGDLFSRGGHVWILCNTFPSYRSTDNGSTWKKINFAGLLTAAHKLAIPADAPTKNGFVAYVLGSKGRQPRLLKSTDGGKKWAALGLPENLPGSGHGYQIFFATSQKGWIGLPKGGMLYTEDGGNTWQRRKLPTDQNVTAMWFDQLGRGFVATFNGFVQTQGITRDGVALYQTSDTGKSWTPVLDGTKDVARIFALGSRRLWAVGNVPGFVKNDLVAILQSQD